MTIHVDPIRAGLVLVLLSPSWWRRIVLRQPEQERFAVRVGSGWTWDDTGCRVTIEVERAIWISRGLAVIA